MITPKLSASGGTDRMIDQSSIGRGLANIRQNGIEAELADLDRELRHEEDELPAVDDEIRVEYDEASGGSR